MLFVFILKEFEFEFWCLTPLSAIFQLYHGDLGQATGKLYHLRLRVECTLYCNSQSRARTHAIVSTLYRIWIITY